MAREGEMEGVLLECDQVIALWRFFAKKPMEDLIAYYWRKQMYDNGSPELRSLLDWVDSHYEEERKAAVAQPAA